MNEVKVKDLKAGDNIEVIELHAKNVSQGKIGKMGTPYQHLWLTDGTGDIRFSLFGEDVNKIQEGQTVKVISCYVKEYPAGSGKLQLALSKDNGDWQVIGSDNATTRKEDIVAPPIQIVSSDARDKLIYWQVCLKAAAELYAGCRADDSDGKMPIQRVLQAAQEMYDYRWDKASSELESLEPESNDTEEHPGSYPTSFDDESPRVQAGTGPHATKLKLIADAAVKENAGWTGPPTIDLVQKFVAVMNGILGGDRERHTWLKWTYGVESSKEVTGAKLQVVLDILRPTYTDKKWIPTKDEAVEAIKAMFRQALKDAG